MNYFLKPILCVQFCFLNNVVDIYFYKDKGLFDQRLRKIIHKWENFKGSWQSSSDWMLQNIQPQVTSSTAKMTKSSIPDSATLTQYD